MDKETVHTLTGSPAVLKEINTVRLLNVLRFSGPTSRAQLARRTGLDAKTITNLSNRLLKDGLIQAEEAIVSGRGRPAETLTINPDAALAIGVDFGACQVSAVLIDFQGHIRCKSRAEFGLPKGKTALLKKADALVREMIAAVPRGQRKALTGIGLSVPGLLDRAGGVVLNAVNIRGFRNVPIVNTFRDYFRRSVILEEASRAMTLAEIWFSPNDLPQDFICVDLGFGIGMGMVHDGRLYRGAHEMSGEIGHTVVVPDGAECTCGKRGCLETIASGHALGRAAARILDNKPGFREASAKALTQAALNGNVRGEQALRRAGEAIGMAIANLVNLLDPGQIILNGGLVKAGPMLVDPIVEAVREHAMARLEKAYPIRVSAVGELAGAMGAAMLPLRKFFEFENIRL